MATTLFLEPWMRQSYPSVDTHKDALRNLRRNRTAHAIHSTKSTRSHIQKCCRHLRSRIPSWVLIQRCWSEAPQSRLPDITVDLQTLPLRLCSLSLKPETISFAAFTFESLQATVRPCVLEGASLWELRASIAGCPGPSRGELGCAEQELG